MKIKFSVVSLMIFVFISELASAATLTGSESFTGSEPTMVPRFFRSGTPGDACSTFSSGNFQYQTIPFKTDNTGQLDVTFDPGTLGTGVFVTFHTAPFDPTNICDRYVWSYGSSQAFSNQQFAVTPNTDMVMIVSGIANSPGVVGGPYTYTIEGIANPTPPPVKPIPTLSEWAQIMMMLSMIGIAAWSYRRKLQ